ncbi:hypothetical protein CBLAS_1848 [Campylobacter blaseri]|uniref:Putative DNA-binding domain-containing protein n=1 Tax=Campylobacter blaseri TaxID=2042961 RepID=A0A2P8R3J8_9BACT|nr:putative DNA-binding domain-containing protein [Campylobacter blaseri]PSM53072.1 hypothetical protein CQ405_00530 [Campylobacter blaseri]PSM54539.1 hypothetical protein CRN67_00530 [Campylobacter blaseri]QKF86991.1 hypothetical protein CBLAS_1848 [Campylobacter blaseri]
MKDLQKDFFYKISRRKPSEDKAITLYQNLVFQRYYEILSNAYPIFASIIPDDKFKKMVQDFLEFGARNEYVWKMPKEFGKYLTSSKKYKNLPYTKDLLWFEWIEIELFMKNYDDFEKSKFSLKSNYILNKNAKIKKLKYKVHLKDLENKEKCALLAYYDTQSKIVIYRELSLSMYEFIKLMKHNSFKKSSKIICKKYDLEKKESKKILKKALKELVNLGVLIKRINSDTNIK